MAQKLTTFVIPRAVGLIFNKMANTNSILTVVAVVRI